MKRRIYPLIPLLLLATAIVSACGGDGSVADTPTLDPNQTVSSEDTPVPTPTEEPTSAETVFGEANIDSVQVLLLESFPVQVNVSARGELPNGCTTIDQISTEMEDTEFKVTITTARPGDAECTEALVPFQETIPLDVLGLDAGRYTVDVNGIRGSFTLDVDNRLPDEESVTPTPEPTATAEPIDTGSATISGMVWHDLCSVIPQTGDEEAVASDGCIVSAEDGGLQANGLLEDGEPGIAEITVSLGEGACPSTGLAVATTDVNGNYNFSGLTAGTYCVLVDALAEENSSVLLPGAWTFPDSAEDGATLTVDEGENVTRVNFGWDYQFLPVPEVDSDTCTNSIEFVEDLTIPDDTILQSGEEFVKSWRLRNNGTCPWTEGYSLTHVGGDGIIGPESLPLPGPVVPGQTIDISVSLTAPDALGTYRDNWQISNATGELFGVGGLVEEAFWVQIIVAEPLPTPVPNSATIGGVVWADSCFLRDDGTPSVGCIETAEGSGVFVADGSLNNNESRIPDVVVTLSADACPEEGVAPPDTVITTAVTDAAGLYRITGLDEGTYCVFIDAFSEDNVDILIPGDWTWPAPGVGRITVVLDAGEELLEIDFGWDDRST